MSNKEKVQTVLKRSKVLLVSDNSTDKTSWKRFFHEACVPVNSFFSVSSYEEACDILETENIPPNILFLATNMGDETGLDLVDLHMEKIPNRSEAWCFVSTDRNSMALAAQTAEKAVDGILMKPYNNQDLNDLLNDSLAEKVEMSKETRLYHTILGEIKELNLESAEEKIEKYREMRPESPYPYYLKGLLSEERNNLDEAVENFYKALEYEDKNYHVLLHLFDVFIAKRDYEQAYTCGDILCENYCVSPTRIPDLIRASLATENIDSLINFCETIIEMEGELTGIERPVAAALALSAKWLAGKPEKKDLVVDAARKAISLVPYTSPIFISAMDSLLDVKNFRDTKKYLDEIPTDDMSEDLIAIDLRYIYLKESPELAFNKAQSLAKLDRANERTYEILLESAKKMGKEKEKLEDMAYDAAKVFPDLKDRFLSIVQA